MPKGIPLTEEVQEQRRKEIFAASVHLFLEKGFNETSMREIAAAAGIGKSTLYDYYKSKDEILVSYYKNELKIITAKAEKIYNQEINNAEKLTRIMEMHLEYLLENKKHFWKLSLEAQRLSLEGQQEIQVKRHFYQDLLQKIVEEGIRQDEFHPVNPFLAARSVLSLLSIAAFTTRPTGTPKEMLEEILAIFFEGIRA
jgi:TetR/AcrR family transcriptional regulator, cholesterol catabolism regulator